ncbi:hypothetical protein HRbin02_00091 [Candidatus Calditenuaceae archaeon HR02]|nr:hypothetical protein HRbin02_00091 [Candidatus Calditenuaceae archaeon HR02]
MRLPPLRIENHLKELSERIYSTKKRFQEGKLDLEEYFQQRCGLEGLYREEADGLLRRRVLRKR